MLTSEFKGYDKIMALQKALLSLHAHTMEGHCKGGYFFYKAEP